VVFFAAAFFAGAFFAVVRFAVVFLAGAAAAMLASSFSGGAPVERGTRFKRVVPMTHANRHKAQASITLHLQ
jgi:hypothetical protein